MSDDWLVDDPFADPSDPAAREREERRREREEKRRQRAAKQAEAEAITPAAPRELPKAREREVVLCHVCGDIMQRAGSCHACPSCGSTSGCS